MILLDSDTLTLLLAAHPRVAQRAVAATEVLAITVITRIEVLRGRFDFMLKAADGEQLQRAQLLLEQSERNLANFLLVPIDPAVAAAFDTLRENKKVKRIGRADLLIASIALARRATLITRNQKHFQRVPGLQVENWAD